MAYDQRKAFDPFNYSSGESTRAFTDAQNVDYGFPIIDDAGAVNDVFNLDPIVDNSRIEEVNALSINFGLTPENITSMYGNVPYPFSGDGAATFQGPKTIRLSRRMRGGKCIADNSAYGAGSGGNGRVKFSEDMHTALTPPIAGDSESSTGIQVETIVNKSFNGQLGPNKTLPDSNIIKYIGLGLIGLAVFI